MNNSANAKGASSEVPEPVVTKSELPSVIKVSVVGLFLLALVAVLFLAKAFLLPVALAFVFALVLSPVVRTLAKNHIPAPATATALVILLFALLGIGAYSLSTPVSQWIENAPQIGRQVQGKIAVLLRPVAAVKEASEQVEKITEGAPAGGAVQEVVIKEPGLLNRAASSLPEILASVGLTLVLLLFLLASGDLFYEKLVEVLPTLSDKKRAVRIARDVEQEVSRYLFTIFMINVGFGAWIAFGMWMIGMPNPALWGVAAFLLNFIPYIGAGIGTILVGVVGLVSFDNVGHALLAPAFYLATTSIEGHILTPMIVGRRLELNAVVVFIAVAFWGWLWGIVGALLAVPILVIIKVFTGHVEGLASLGSFLSDAKDAHPEDPPPTPVAKAVGRGNA